ncbi:MAG: carbohydrate binding family 9 domain-containing protein [Armatimonadota bacterium]|nr:carbohydrate binding family 9 domain-containing protein [Armatimonadota bacterium]
MRRTRKQKGLGALQRFIRVLVSPFRTRLGAAPAPGKGPWTCSTRQLAVGIAVACSLVAGAWRAATQELPLPSLALGTSAPSPPRIDGRLDDPCWQEAARVSNFVVNTTGQPAVEQTTVWVTYDSRCLYVAFECLELQMDRVLARVADRDGPVFRDDVVELFLDPHRDRFTYYQFAVNLLGTRFDLKGDAAGGRPGWDAPWNAATARGTDRWWAEMAIPFASLDLDAEQTSDIWGINFAREQKPRGELSSWSFTGGSFAQPNRFGELRNLFVDFRRYAYGVEVVDLGDRLVGNNALTLRITAPETGRRLVSLEVYLHDGESRRREVAANLTGGKPLQVVLPYVLPSEGLYRMVARVREPDTGEVVRAVGLSVSVPPLLELALFPNHYRREVWVRPRLNVRPTDLRTFRLTARVLKDGEVVPPQQEVATVVVKEPTIRFSLEKSGPGDYQVEVTLLPKTAGSGVVKETASFSLAPAAANGDPLVSVLPDNALQVAGRRFFPIGLYRYGNGNPTEKALAEVREAGFNLISVPPGDGGAETRARLDRVRAAGLMAWIPLSVAMEISPDDEGKRGRLRALVPALAGHPALLCWESADEPAWTGRKAEDLYRGYLLVRELDPDHPVWTNHAPRNTVDELALFNRATDIAGADIYPVPEPQRQSDLPNPTISVVGDETTKNILAVLNRKPVFMVLQGFAWAELSRRQGNTAPAVYPTRQQTRFMAYHAIVRGARGILYWGVNYTPKPSPFWNDLRTVVYELAQLHDVLAGPNSGDQVEVLEGAPAIETLVRRPGESMDRFIIAVNASPKPVRARLAVPRAMPKVSWRVLFEGRRVVGNPIVDQFEPYGVHIYTASTTFPEERLLSLPPVPESARLRPEDLTEPGNLLINPGAEYSQENEEAPVGWELRPPFGGSVTTEVKRSGRFALALRSDGPSAMPLWVQSGIATAPGRRYRFSAYARTRPAGLPIRLYAEWVGSDGKYLGGYVPAQWLSGSAGWQVHQIEFTVTHPDAQKLYVVMQLRGEGEAWFDDVRLQEVR